MQIAIVGAGISGLFLYLCLEKHGITKTHSVVLYEARGAPREGSSEAADTETFNASVIGASLGLSTTGLKVLERFDQNLYEEVLATGHVLRRCKISNARGWTLANVPVGAEHEIMLMIGREAFWRCLKSRVPDWSIKRRKVARLDLSDSSLHQKLCFQDGGQETVDLVVGADGIWSKVRKAMFSDQRENEYEFSPQYEGLVGVGGFVPASKLGSVGDGDMNIVFGGNGFFGFSYTTPLSEVVPLQETQVVWWSTYTLDSCPDDWRHIDREDVNNQLRGRHLGWTNDTVCSIVKDVTVDSLYPTFTTPLLPTWHKDGCVLVGDAAHALQPSSGQGASMAMEDCETLALLLRYFLDIDKESDYRKAISLYSEIRMPRLEMVHRKAQEVGSMKHDMRFIQEMLMYFFIWLINAFRLNETYNRKLNDYDVPGQVHDLIKKRNGP